MPSGDTLRRTRRRYLTVVGAATTGSIAGCVGESEDSGAENGDDGDDEADAEDTGNGDDGGDGDDGDDGDEGDESATTGPGVTDVRLLLNWQLSGLHAPYVAARENGFYADERFENVELESGDGSDFAANQAGLGNVEFAISSADQILTVNSRGLSPRCVGVAMQRNPNVVFATQDGFGDLKDAEQLEGATVGSGPGMVRHTDAESVADYAELSDTRGRRRGRCCPTSSPCGSRR